MNKVNEKALILDKSLKAWIGGMDAEGRSALVDTLFGILDDAGINTVDDLANMKIPKLVELLKIHSSLDKENQEMIKESLLDFLQKSGNALYDILFRK